MLRLEPCLPVLFALVILEVGFYFLSRSPWTAILFYLFIYGPGA
jgi:hypothetical protein